MTPTLLSLIGLVLTALFVTWWAYAPSQRDRWKEASRLPFEESATRESEQ